MKKLACLIKLLWHGAHREPPRRDHERVDQAIERLKHSVDEERSAIRRTNEARAREIEKHHDLRSDISDLRSDISELFRRMNDAEQNR